MSKTIEIEDYTSKSFVIRGNTRDYKESLKEMGGKWNSRLTDKKTGEKFGAWLFWSNKQKELERWVSGGCKEVVNSEVVNSEVPNNKILCSLRLSEVDQSALTIKSLEKKVDQLTLMVKALCEFNGIEIEAEKDDHPPKSLLNKSRKYATADDEDIIIESDDDEHLVPPKRLLVRKPTRR